jgi:hypothetical protein
MRHEIPEEPACRDKTLVPPSASTDPLQNMEISYFVQKAHAGEIHEKAGIISIEQLAI